VLDACARRDLGAVVAALGAAGLTQGRLVELTGIPQGRLSEWRTGKREAKAVSTFQKFADGLGLPRTVTCMHTNTPDHHFVIAVRLEHPKVSVACGCSGHASSSRQ
jgi:transcriptional regulator with XRE-family HTH domain